jgi:hypothetical protein
MLGEEQALVLKKFMAQRNVDTKTSLKINPPAGPSKSKTLDSAVKQELRRKESLDITSPVKKDPPSKPAAKVKPVKQEPVKISEDEDEDFEKEILTQENYLSPVEEEDEEDDEEEESDDKKRKLKFKEEHPETKQEHKVLVPVYMIEEFEIFVSISHGIIRCIDNIENFPEYNRRHARIKNDLAVLMKKAMKGKKSRQSKKKPRVEESDKESNEVKTQT